MADPSDAPWPHEDAALSESEKGRGLARWQKVVGIIGLVVLLLVVIGLFIGGGHTPPVQHGL
ncbi:MAG: hypothetical protein ACRDZM_04140 [Acidimicrobiia bacterium]